MIIHRAFVREVLHACGAVSVILLAIFVVARLMGFLRQAVDGDIPANSVFLLLLLKTVTYLDILAPLVLYVATLLVIGRWVRDNELTVINACGIGMKQFLRPAAVLFAVVGGFTALFSFYLSPLSAEASRALVAELRARAEVVAVTAGVFTPMRGGDGVYFVESYDAADDSFRNLFIYGGDDGTRIVTADVGYVASGDGNSDSDEDGNDDEKFLVLQDGRQYHITGDGARDGVRDEHSIMDFQKYALRLNSPARAAIHLPVKAMPTSALIKADHREAVGELQWRIAKVVMPAVLMIFALAFSSVTYRKTRFPGMLPALLVYFAYSNLLGLGVALIRRGGDGVVDPRVMLWTVHLLFLALAFFLLRRRNLNQPLLPSPVS